jgi:DNA mismatch repair protein MutS
VRREVVETLTPGALLAEDWIPGGRNNWIAAIQRGRGAVGQRGGACGLAAIDLSTGEFVLETLDAEGLGEALSRLNPAEIVISGDDSAPLPFRLRAPSSPLAMPGSSTDTRR